MSRAGSTVAATLALAVTVGAGDAGATTPAVRHLGLTLSTTGPATTGKAVRFTMRVTLPHGDRLTAFSLDFGDHTKPLRGSKPVAGVKHTYLTSGRYVVKLTAVDLHRTSRHASLVETVSRSTSSGGTRGQNPVNTSGLPDPPAGCNGTSTPGTNAYNSTPVGAGPWEVPIDPCNSEGIGDTDSDIYANADYWAAEKRPDVWADAVLRYGYADAPYGPWNVEEDADRAGYPIDSTPQAGDLAVWHDDASMGSDSTGTMQVAGPGGQSAYVEAINPDGTILISEMGAGAEDGGYTYTLTYDPDTAFIHTRQR